MPAIPDTMCAMRLRKGGGGLEAVQVECPRPKAGQVMIRIRACGVCRTDLHIVDGELDTAGKTVIPGHEVVGEVVLAAADTAPLKVGTRVGVPWLGHTCGHCEFCLAGRENLCDEALFTGYQFDGGYAEYMVAEAAYCFPLPPSYGDTEVAPLLCAGLIGYRAYRMAGDAHRIGLYGFGAAAHILAQIAVSEGREIYAFTRPADASGQAFARRLGAVWAGASGENPPALLDAAIIFAPVGALIPEALSRVKKGGRVICAGIHMSPIPQFDYALLWGEREVVSVANLTRQDGVDFFQTAERISIQTAVTTYPLEQASRALDDLRDGRLEGAAVLQVVPHNECFADQASSEKAC